MSYIQLNHVMKNLVMLLPLKILTFLSKRRMFLYAGAIRLWKTTTLRMIAGFEDLDGGEIKSVINYCHRRNNFYLPPEAILAWSFQAFAVYYMTVYDNAFR